MKVLPVRKHPRLKGYAYNNGGAYFLTFCVKDRHEILGKIDVGRGILDVPCMQLSEYGGFVVEAIGFLDKNNVGIAVDKYAVMPNHMHLIIFVDNTEDGASGKPRPANAVIPKFVSSVKHFTNKRAGFDMWQHSFHDRIIRDETEYQRIWTYIDENPAKWQEDCYYM